MPALVESLTSRLRDSSELHDALSRVEAVFDNEVGSRIEEVDRLCAHIERYRGKMLRPTMVLVSGLATGELTDAHVTLGAVVELVHMATLVHDDVIDESEVRRRGKTVNALHGNETAVLLGDYLIASSYRLCSTLDTQEYALLIGEVTRRTCEGELLQLHHRGDLEIPRDVYLDIIDRKTASLIGASCKLGAMASGARKEICDSMLAYGSLVGSAFQIQDDLLDLFSQERAVGKSVGRDMGVGTMTLPSILLRDESAGEQREDALRAIREAMSGSDPDRIRELMKRAGADRSSREVAMGMVDRATGHLDSLVDGPWKALLRDLGEASVERSL
ncbi:MAG: polyprenyl synthetase family protein [Planctomycetota bacterium]|jgi:octaprenyl-diphosphate synthase